MIQLSLVQLQSRKMTQGEAFFLAATEHRSQSEKEPTDNGSVFTPPHSRSPPLELPSLSVGTYRCRGWRAAAPCQPRCPHCGRYCTPPPTATRPPRDTPSAGGQRGGQVTGQRRRAGRQVTGQRRRGRSPGRGARRGVRSPVRGAGRAGRSSGRDAWRGVRSPGRGAWRGVRSPGRGAGRGVRSLNTAQGGPAGHGTQPRGQRVT